MIAITQIHRWIQRQKLKRMGLTKELLRHITYVGIPNIDIKGHLICDGHIYMVNTTEDSVLGIGRPCKLTVYKDAYLHFKGQCGMSNTVIVATKGITIGDNVMIGGGCTIIDSDFHSLDYHNWFSPNDEKLMGRKEVIIEDNVFLGTNCLVLKGVHIGSGAIVAAGSVVTKDIPQNQIWGGNPAKFIKNRA